MTFFLSVAITLGLLVFLLSLFPLINWAVFPGLYRPLIQARLNRLVSCRNLRLWVIPRFRLRMEGVVIDEDPSFGTTPFATLKRLDLTASWGPIAFRRSPTVHVVLHGPSLAIVSVPGRGLNVETFGEHPGRWIGPHGRAEDNRQSLKTLCRLLDVNTLDLTEGVVTYEVMEHTRELRQRWTEVRGRLARSGVDGTARMDLSGISTNRNTWTATASFRTREEACDVERLEISCLQGRTSGCLAGTLLPSVDLTLDAPYLDARDIGFLTRAAPEFRACNLQARLWAQAPGHHLFHVSAGVFHGRLSLEGRFMEHQMVPQDVEAVFQDIRFEELLALVQPQGLRMAGKARLTLRLRGRQRSGSGPPASLEGSGHLHIADGTLGGVAVLEGAAAVMDEDEGGGPWWPLRYAALEADLSLLSDGIAVTKAEVQGKGMQAVVRGVVHFDRTVRLQMDLRFSEALSRSLVRKAPVLEPGIKHGWLSLPLIVIGTLDRPLVRLDKEALGLRARDQLRDQVLRWWTRKNRATRPEESSWKETMWKRFRRSSDETSGKDE